MVRGEEEGREEEGEPLLVVVLVLAEEGEEEEGGVDLSATMRSGRSSHLVEGIAMTAAMATC